MGFENYALQATQVLEPVEDLDDTIIFDIINRSVFVRDYKDIVVKEDANSRNIHFRIQRYFEDTDLSTKTIKIFYVNASGNADFSFVHDIEVTEDELRFQWLISSKVCLKEGAVKFKVNFSSDDGYDWNSLQGNLFVSDSLSEYGSIPEPGNDWYDSWVIIANDVLQEAQEQATLSKQYAENAKQNEESISAIIPFVELSAENSLITWDFSQGNKAKVVLESNTAIEINNISNGCIGQIRVVGAELILPDNSDKSIDFDYIYANTGQYYLYTFVYDGTRYEWHRSVIG